MNKSRDRSTLVELLLLVMTYAGGAMLLSAFERQTPAAAGGAHAGGSGQGVAVPGDHGRLASRPSEISRRGWKDILWRVYSEASEDRILSVAAGMTFYGLLAVFPAVSAFVALYGLIADASTINEHIAELMFILPAGAGEIIADQVKRSVEASTGGLSVSFLVSFLFALWSANAGMKATFDGLNVAYEEREKRGLIALNAQSLLFTVLAILAALAAVLAVVVAPIVLQLFYLDKVVETTISLLRWPLMAVCIMFALAVLYRFGPSRAEAKWRWVTWGSAVAALLWLIISFAFSWYVSGFGSYDKNYGALGAVIGFMTWIWLSAAVILLGAELNAEMEHQTILDTTTGTPKPLGLRGARMADTVGAAAE